MLSIRVNKMELRFLGSSHISSSLNGDIMEVQAAKNEAGHHLYIA